LLFSGCIGKTLDNDVLQATIKILTHGGIHFALQTDSDCCGGLESHFGKVTRAHTLLQNIRQRYQHYETILYSLSGCSHQLEQLSNSQEATQYLSTIATNLALTSCNQRVVIHTPCSQPDRNASATLLKYLPNIQLLPLRHTHCCGAGASLGQITPDLTYTDALAKEILQINPDVVVSSNYACRRHIAAAIAKRGKRVKILHPITLFAEHLLPCADTSQPTK
jgi:glycolate oxidase iron-sulfur subunit